MADEHDQKTEFTPEALRDAKGNFDPSALSHEHETKAESPASGKPQPSAAELAEQQRRGDKDIDGAPQTREERLVATGRARHTTGRLGGND